jgi:DNA polymerase III subunit alpha, Gram-positive type
LCLVWVDTETTGLNPSIHEVIEIGLVVVKGDTLEEIDRYYSKVAPDHIETADERALLINHYSWQGWQDAPQKEVVVAEIGRFFSEDHVLCGHNVEFDIAFIESMFKRCDLEPPKYAGIIDTKRVAKSLNVKSASYRLGALCQKFGIEQERAHCALDDVVANVELFRHLQRGYNINLPSVVLAKTGKQQLRVAKGGRDIYF